MTNINVGTVPDDGTGNVLRDAFIITNSNFSTISGEVEALGLGLNFSISQLDTRVGILETTSAAQAIDINSVNSSIAAINSLILNQNIAINSLNLIVASQSAAIAELYEIIGNL
ncbi:hypothetical protein UFOVP639_4 [uncultured Caudovirales phage]|uniref:Uncharacterized protein n=1 Tax=uncultured Caudovirales phage TaxID=2100421 RepID=A0A6J5N8S1_9CAUD|nr:hypothetical protein UFOVP639_4 [uncultured Caudovirales phage]